RGERGKLTGFQLWQSGGVSAMNNALQRANQHHNICRTNCNIYFANLDDDDTWSPDHLRYYCGAGGNPFPPRLVPQDRVNNWPEGFGGSILHSSWSWKMEIFRGFRYRAQWDYPANYNGPREADADLFEVVRAYIIENKLHYYHSNRATIEHLIEGGNPCAKNGPLFYPD
ncbi:unnamed protein product, partial [Rotaria sordida]